MGNKIIAKILYNPQHCHNEAAISVNNHTIHLFTQSPSYHCCSSHFLTGHGLLELNILRAKDLVAMDSNGKYTTNQTDKRHMPMKYQRSGMQSLVSQIIKVLLNRVL